MSSIRRRLLAAIAAAGSKAPPGSQTFSYTGAYETFVVPVGIYSIAIEALGPASGSASGGRAIGTFSVTPGDTLYVYVGGQPSGATGGFNGGANGRGSFTGQGGAGATDVRTVVGDLSSRLIVAGGAGGKGGGSGGNGGSGGAATGGAGSGIGLAGGGGGGTQAAGGSGGTGTAGVAGSIGVGGLGGNSTYGGGGAGGGYYGGGGGGAYTSTGGGGAGGGSNGPTAALSTNTQGYNAGAGSVTISWT